MFYRFCCSGANDVKEVFTMTIAGDIELQSLTKLSFAVWH